jgi:hypothetical protein
MRFGVKKLFSLTLALAAIGVVIQIVRWGRPIPPALLLIAQQDRNGDGQTDRWEFAVVNQGASKFVELDEDFDGRIEKFLYLTGDRIENKTSSRSSSNQPKRRLILCVDGVPFEIMNALWRQRAFREFFAPKRLISTFPADTDVALATLLQAPKVRGYENRYFDRGENRVKGGVFVTLAQDVSYDSLLDYTLSGWLRGPSFIMPEKVFFGDLGRLRRRFLESNKPIFVAHLPTTDPLLHLRPPERIRQYLLAVEAVLRELIYLNGGELEITLLSDHGHSLTKSKRVEVEQFLEANGYRISDRLDESRTIVIPIYGLVGTVAIYAKPEDVAPLARLVSELEGVEFSARREDQAVIVEGKRGRARIHFDAGRNAFRYEAVEGDPLQLGSVVDQLKREGKQDHDDFIQQSDWLVASASSPYPDALRRLTVCFTNHVENRADLIVNLADGAYFGSRRFDWFVEIESTHGSLNARSSLGFIMSTSQPLPDSVTAEDALSGRPVR